MAEYKSFGEKVGMRLWLCALGASLVALVVYALTLAGYVFPGESAHLFTRLKFISHLLEFIRHDILKSIVLVECLCGELSELFSFVHPSRNDLKRFKLRNFGLQLPRRL